MVVSSWLVDLVADQSLSVRSVDDTGIPSLSTISTWCCVGSGGIQKLKRLWGVMVVATSLEATARHINGGYNMDKFKKPK